MFVRLKEVGELICAAFVVVAVCAFVAPASIAWATSSHGLEQDSRRAAHPTPEARITVPGTDGYRIEVGVSAVEAWLIASKGHSAALYSAQHSTIRHDVFRAQFGRLGKVSLRFSGSRAKDGAPRGTCRHSASVQRGRFYGLVVFRGEGNFTRLKRRAAYGTVRTLGEGNTQSHCRLGGPAKGAVMQSAKVAPQYELRSVMFTRDGFVQFFAGPRAIGEIQGWERNVGIPLGLPPLEKRSQGFSALAFETKAKAGMRIVRLAAAAGPKASFMADPAKLLSMMPPSPFAGTGQIELCPPSSLLGSLKVLFPGKAVSLTGQQWGTLVSPIPSGC
jgi:hypothetical protein